MKLTQQRIIELLESKVLVDKVLGELNFIQELPAAGVVAGQAVSSIISEILGVKGLNPVVNDIDIFIPFHRSFNMSAETALFFERKKESYSNELSSIRDIIMEEDYREIKLSTGPLKYEIVGTTRFRKINKVFVQSKHYSPTEQRNNIIFDIINSFDINSTQVGIDINSKKIFYTRNFVYFLFSRQLEIVNWNTPSHSLIRLFRKNSELGSFANFEETKMLASVLLGGYKNISDLMNYFTVNSDLRRNLTEKEITKRQYEIDSGNPFYSGSRDVSITEVPITLGGYNTDYWVSYNQRLMSTLPLFFGKKQMSDFNKISDKLDNFYVSKRVKRGDKCSDTDFEWFGEKGGDSSYELHSLLPSNKSKEVEELISMLRDSNLHKYGNSKYISQYIKDVESTLYDMENNEINRHGGVDPFTLIYSIPKVLKSYKNVRKNVVYFLNDCESNYLNKSVNYSAALKDFPLDVFVLDTLTSRMFVGIEELNSIDKYDLYDFDKKLKKHRELAYLHYISSFTEMQTINAALNQLEKTYGELIYGLIGRIQFLPKDLTVENVSPYLDKMIKSKNEVIKERGIDLTSKVGKIKELVTGLELYIEGSEMGHCVGGYTYQVRGGQSLIIAMENSEKRRMTMEIQPNLHFKEGTDSPKFLVNQLFGRFNEKVSYDESIDLLREVDKVYNIFPLPDGNKSRCFGYYGNAQYVRPAPGLYQNLEIDIDEEEIPF